MKEFLSTYAEVLQNNHDLIGQVSSLCVRYKVNMAVTIKIVFCFCDMRLCRVVEMCGFRGT
jgi:hypothetical protein